MPQTTPEWRKNATETELRGRAAEMRSEWAELTKLDRESGDYRKAKTEFMDEMGDIDVQLDLAIRSEQRSAPRGVFSGPTEFETRSPGEIVTEHEGFRAWMKHNASRERIEGPSPTIEVRDLVSLGTTANLLAPVQQPRLVGVDRRRFFLRQLLNTVQVNSSAVPYIRELNSAANATGAQMFQEGGNTPKAQGKIEFQPDLAPVGIIAVNIPITTQMMEDVPMVVGYINGRLRYMLEVKEEDELLNGDGTGLNLRGLLNTPGVQTATATAGEAALTIANAIMRVERVNGYADGVVMNTADAWTMYTKVDRGGAGWDAGTPFSGIPMNVWGLPVVRTNAVAPGTAVVGAFGTGATVLDRRGATVRAYDQHENYATLNRVLLQAEERVGLAVERPDWFVKATVA